MDRPRLDWKQHNIFGIMTRLWERPFGVELNRHIVVCLKSGLEVRPSVLRMEPA